MKDSWTTERFVEAAATPALLMATPTTGSSEEGGEWELTYKCRHRTWSWSGWSAPAPTWSPAGRRRSPAGWSSPSPPPSASRYEATWLPGLESLPTIFIQTIRKQILRLPFILHSMAWSLPAMAWIWWALTSVVGGQANSWEEILVQSIPANFSGSSQRTENPSTPWSCRWTNISRNCLNLQSQCHGLSERLRVWMENFSCVQLLYIYLNIRQMKKRSYGECFQVVVIEKQSLESETMERVFMDEADSVVG